MNTILFNMNFGEPFGGILPGARGAALAALLRTGTPLTGRQIHGLIGDRHSLGSVQQALRTLEHLGLITTETIGRAGVHRVNDEHEAIAPLRALSSPLDMLTRVVRDEVPDADAVLVFGSVARGEAGPDSDIDLAVVASDGWEGRAHLQERVHARLGNACDVLHLTPADINRPPAQREPVVADILRDGIALMGEMPRVSRKVS